MGYHTYRFQLSERPVLRVQCVSTFLYHRLTNVLCMADVQRVLWCFRTYVQVGLGHFLGLKILNFNNFWVFHKNEYFWGMKILWILFWRSSQIWTIFRVILYALLGYFLKVKVQNWGYFFLGGGRGVAKIPNIFWGAWNSWYFWGWTVNAGPKPTYKEKMRVPPRGWWSGMLALPTVHAKIYFQRGIIHSEASLHFLHPIKTRFAPNQKHLKDIYSCPIEIIKGLTDKGQFQYLTKLKGHQEGTYLYTTQFLSLK